MAVHVNGGGGANLTGFRTTAVLPPSMTMTASIFARMTSTVADFNDLLLVNGVFDLGTDATGSTWEINGGTISGPAIQLGVWYFLAVTNTGSAVTIWWKVVGQPTIQSASAALSTTTVTSITVGGGADLTGNSNPNCDIYSARLWPALLSQAELDLESFSLSPVRTADLFLDLRLQTDADLIDRTARSAVYTNEGNSSIVPGPPLPDQPLVRRARFAKPAAVGANVYPSGVPVLGEFGAIGMAWSVLPSGAPAEDRQGASVAAAGALPSGVAAASDAGAIAVAASGRPAGASADDRAGAAVATSAGWPSGVAASGELGAAVSAPSTLPSGTPSLGDFGSDVVSGAAWPAGAPTLSDHGADALAPAALPGGVGEVLLFGAPVTLQVTPGFPAGVTTEDRYGAVVAAAAGLPAGLPAREDAGASVLGPSAYGAGVAAADAFGALTGASASVVRPSGIQAEDRHGAAVFAPAGLPSGVEGRTDAGTLAAAPTSLPSGADPVLLFGAVTTLQVTPAFPAGLPADDRFGAHFVAWQALLSGAAAREDLGAVAIGTSAFSAGITAPELFGALTTQQVSPGFPAGIAAEGRMGAIAGGLGGGASGAPSRDDLGAAVVALRVLPAGAPDAVVFGAIAGATNALGFMAGSPAEDRFGAVVVSIGAAASGIAPEDRAGAVAPSVRALPAGVEWSPSFGATVVGATAFSFGFPAGMAPEDRFGAFIGVAIRPFLTPARRICLVARELRVQTVAADARTYLVPQEE